MADIFDNEEKITPQEGDVTETEERVEETAGEQIADTVHVPEAAPVEEAATVEEAAQNAPQAVPEPEAEESPYFNNLTFRPRESAAETPRSDDASAPYFPPQTTADGQQYGSQQYGEPHYYDRLDENRPPVAPQHAPYGVPNVNGGGISYTPVQTPAKQQKPPRKRGGKSFAVILAAVCILLSFGAGFLGAYVASVSGQLSGDRSGTTSNSPVIRRVDNSDKEADSTDKKSSSAYASVVESVRDAVVEIETEYRTTGWFQYVTGGAGSGVIISEDGYIITNNHVICGSDDETVADSITVRTRSGEEYNAKVVGKDSDADIAVIKIEATGLTAAVFGDSDELEVGDEVIAIGNPLGQLGGTVTNGIISSLAREIEVDGKKMTLLQTNAAINPGNSGGGLFNLKGELIGVVNAKSSGSDIEGLAFAIPSNDAFNTSTQLMEYGYVKGKPIVGITLVNVNSAYKAAQFGVNAMGVYISEVTKGYNDDLLQPKDRIIAVNGKEVASGEDVIEIIKSSKVGDKLTFTLYRNGKMMDVEVTCYENTSN